MRSPRVAFVDVVVVITELLESAYIAHLRRSIAVQLGRRTKTHDYDLRMLLTVHIPEIVTEHPGFDADLIWHLACRNLERRRGAIEERVLIENPDGRHVIQSASVWEVFRGRVATSPAGLAWGHLETRLPRRWS